MHLRRRWQRLDSSCLVCLAQSCSFEAAPNGEREIDGDAFFDYICEWDEAGYIMCAGTGRPGTSGNHDNDNQGIADSHAYALVAAKKDVCGKFKMVCFRNPWGTGATWRGRYATGTPECAPGRRGSRGRFVVTVDST